MAGVLVPLWATPAAAQIGVGDVEQMVCAETSLAQLFVIGLGGISIYFFLKFLLRLVSGVKASNDSSDIGGSFTTNVKSSLYSLFAGLLPVFILIALGMAGIDVRSCLFSDISIL